MGVETQATKSGTYPINRRNFPEVRVENPASIKIPSFPTWKPEKEDKALYTLATRSLEKIVLVLENTVPRLSLS